MRKKNRTNEKKWGLINESTQQNYFKNGYKHYIYVV